MVVASRLGAYVGRPTQAARGGRATRQRRAVAERASFSATISRRPGTSRPEADRGRVHGPCTSSCAFVCFVLGLRALEADRPGVMLGGRRPVPAAAVRRSAPGAAPERLQRPARPTRSSLLANSLRSGYSLLQSMELVSREAPSPTAEEFGRVVREVGLGLSPRAGAGQPGAPDRTARTWT